MTLLYISLCAGMSVAGADIRAHKASSDFDPKPIMTSKFAVLHKAILIQPCVWPKKT